MSIEAFRHYIDARDALAAGDHARAGADLEKALRSPPDNRFLRQHVEQFLDHNSLAGEAALEILRVEVQRRS